MISGWELVDILVSLIWIRTLFCWVLSSLSLSACFSRFSVLLT